MAVSSNTLFHFTKKESLKKILFSKGFYVQYSDEHFEEIISPERELQFAFIPMISFCDLTVMQLARDSKHRINFGDYGIGLTKEWGRENRVSPVIYTHEKSQPTSQLYNINLYLDTFAKKLKGGKKILGIRKELIDLFKFIKPYQGRWQHGEPIPNDQDDIIYYNEREWRYCPLLSDYKVLLGNTRYNKKRKAELNEALKKEFIYFNLENIKFIVIKQKNELNEFVEEIKKMGLDPEIENRLISKIISFQAIEEDF
jgi:hypothetical protein